MPGKTSKSNQTAAEFMAELQADPEYRERVARLNAERKLAVEANQADVAPVLSALASIGFAVDSLAELRRVKDYQRAIPTLIEWLPRVSRDDVRADIVRCLTIKTATIARRPLLELFPRAENDSIRWAVGNVLGELADDEIGADLLGLVGDRQWGIARQMIVLGLAKLQSTAGVNETLIGLLTDHDVDGHALEALVARKASVPREVVEPFLNHKQAWIRKAARSLAK